MSISRRVVSRISMPPMKRRATRLGKGETVTLGCRTFQTPSPGLRSAIRKALRSTLKHDASRLYQLASGHATTAAFLRDRCGPNERWRCQGGRQSRGQLFKECPKLERCGKASGKRGRDIGGCVEEQKRGLLPRQGGQSETQQYGGAGLLGD